MEKTVPFIPKKLLQTETSEEHLYFLQNIDACFLQIDSKGPCNNCNNVHTTSRISILKKNVRTFKIVIEILANGKLVNFSRSLENGSKPLS